MLPRRDICDHTSNERTTLDRAHRNDRVRVLRVFGRPALIQRLAALGVVPGVTITVLKPRNPSIVAIGGARIAIGESAAEAVEVEVEVA